MAAELHVINLAIKLLQDLSSFQTRVGQLELSSSIGPSKKLGSENSAQPTF